MIESDFLSMVHIFIFFFNDTATTEIYTLSLHDALPISGSHPTSASTSSARTATPSSFLKRFSRRIFSENGRRAARSPSAEDRKSTRLNSSHANISYAVFCLKKKKTHLTYFPSTI